MGSRRTPAQIGDRVTMDLKLTVDDESISDLKDNPFELTDERPAFFWYGCPYSRHASWRK